MTGHVRLPGDEGSLRDSINLTTLIRWGARYYGSFLMSHEEGETGKQDVWRVIVLRAAAGVDPSLSRIVFNECHPDLSKIVHMAAKVVRGTPEWVSGARADSKKRSRARARGADAADTVGGREFDWDIWRKGVEEKPPLTSRGQPIRDKRFGPDAVLDMHKRGDFGSVEG